MNVPPQVSGDSSFIREPDKTQSGSKEAAIPVDISKLPPAASTEMQKTQFVKEAVERVKSGLAQSTEMSIKALIEGFEKRSSSYSTLLQTFLNIPCQELRNMKIVNPELHAQMVHAVLTMICTGDPKEILPVFGNDKDIVKTLAGLGSDVNSASKDKDLPLCEAAGLKIEPSKADMLVRILVALGGNVNQLGLWGGRPLGNAVWSNCTETVKLLASLGADVNLPDDSGETPLRWALLRGRSETVQTLLSLHASFTSDDVNQPDMTSNSPLSLAVVSDDEAKIRLLVSLGANVNQVGEKGETPVRKAIRLGRKGIIKVLIQLGAQVTPADLNQPDTSGKTPLDRALFFDDFGLIKLLVQLGAQVNPAHLNQPDKMGNTPLISTLISTDLSLKDKVEMVKLLVSLGADVNQQRSDGVTPLTFLITNLLPSGNKELVELLLSLGADPNRPHQGGITPLDFANVCPPLIGKPIQECLLDHGADPGWSNVLNTLKAVAHSWTLEGEGRCYYEKAHQFRTITLPNWLRSSSLKLLRQLFQEFLHEQMSAEYQTLGETILKILDRSVDCLLPAELPKELVRLSENEPVLIAGGTFDHTIGFILYRNHLYYCNRGGEEAASPGILEFEFDPGLQNELQSFLQIVRCSTIDKIYASLRALRCKIISKIRQHPQKVGNCSWANLESSLLELLLICMQVLEAPGTDRQRACRSIYKGFTKFAREKTLLAYLREGKPDPSVLRQIEAKIRQDDSPFSPEEKKELLKKIEEKIQSSSDA